jgi:hypothetical protein
LKMSVLDEGITPDKKQSEEDAMFYSGAK